MKYYQVTEEPKREIYISSLKCWIPLVKGELFTEKELNRLNLNPASKIFAPVEVSRKKIYWFFGARYAL